MKQSQNKDRTRPKTFDDRLREFMKKSNTKQREIRKQNDRRRGEKQSKPAHKKEAV